MDPSVHMLGQVQTSFRGALCPSASSVLFSASIFSISPPSLRAGTTDCHRTLRNFRMILMTDSIECMPSSDCCARCTPSCSPLTRRIATQEGHRRSREHLARLSAAHCSLRSTSPIVGAAQWSLTRTCRGRTLCTAINDDCIVLLVTILVVHHTMLYRVFR